LYSVLLKATPFVAAFSKSTCPMILTMCRSRVSVKSWIILIYLLFLQPGLVKQVSCLCTYWLYLQSRRTLPCVLLPISRTIHAFWSSALQSTWNIKWWVHLTGFQRDETHSQQASIMEKFGLQALVINSDTIQEARKRGEDLWKRAETGPSLLFMAPEQLISKGFNDLAKDDGEFAARLCAIAVDEAHLLNSWGRSWRQAFQQIGFVRARFPNVVLIALTATMRAGQPTESVCESLGLHRGRFHFIRRSNARPDVQILFRTMKSGLGGKKFPELDWVLAEKRKTFTHQSPFDNLNGE
jgi:hypothetical protein